MVLCVVALIVVGVKIYVDRTEKKHQEQAALEKQRQEQVAEQVRLAAEQAALEKQRQGQAAEQARLAAKQAEKQRQEQATERARTEEEILEFYMVEQKPELVHSVNPAYPEIARKAGLTGKVFLKFLVDKNGQVSNVTVLKGQEIFRQAAIDAILQYRFKPAKKNGKPVSVWMTQPMSFRLN